jgi:hypothetical protein
MSNEIFLYMHDANITGGCGGIAFVYDHLPAPGEDMVIECVLPFNGVKPDAYAPITCATCGNRFPITYSFPSENFVSYKS